MLSATSRGTSMPITSLLRDRRRDRLIDRAGVVDRWGVEPESIPDYLALVGDSADGYPGLPGWGARSSAAVLKRFGHLEAIPLDSGEWHVDVRSAGALAATLRERWPDAQLYRDLARLRTDVPLPQRDPQELLWQGARRRAWAVLCAELGAATLATRPHRWQD